MIKEEAIEILSDMRAEYNIFSDDEEEATRYHALSWAIQALNEQQRTGRWIPVSERLPEHNQQILAYYADIDLIMLISFNSHGITTMTAWMPLPKQYGGESDGT